MIEPYIELRGGGLQRVVEEFEKRVPLGAIGGIPQVNERYQFVKFTDNVKAGEVVADQERAYKLKSLKVADADDPSLLTAVLNMAANEVLEADSLAEMIDTATGSDILNQRIFITANTRAENTGTSADDITFQIRVETLRERTVPGQERRETLPASYNQTSNNAVVVYRRIGSNVGTYDLSADATNGGYRLVGVAVADVTASSTSPRYGWVMTRGTTRLLTTAAVDNGATLLAAASSANAGKVTAISGSTAPSYVVGTAVEKTTAAGGVRAEVQIG